LAFPTQELWEMFSNPTQGIYATIIALFAVLGVAFLAVRLPREAQRREHDVSAASPPLRRRQLFNVGLVMFVSQAVQVLLVSLMIGVFLTVLRCPGGRRFHADAVDRQPGQRALPLQPLRREAGADQRAPPRGARPRRLLGLLLLDRSLHGLDLPRGVPGRAHLRDAEELRGARRVPEAARAGGRRGLIRDNR